MNSIMHKATMLLIGLVGLSSLAAISTFTLTANNLAGLRRLEIRSINDFSIDAHENILLTAQGDYVTYMVPLRAKWTVVEGQDYGYLEGSCESTQSCSFQSNGRGGDVIIHAEANGFSDEQTITIRTPQTSTPFSNPFADDIPSWAEQPIVSLRDHHIIQGYNDGRYGAGDLLTRGQLITIFYRTLQAMHLIDTLNCPIEYNDVQTGHYAYDAACTFRNRGWTDSLTTLEPNDPVTRGETASLLNRVIGGTLLSAQDLRLSSVIDRGQIFSDVPVSSTYFVDTAVAKSLEIMKGNPDGTFGAHLTLNRAEAATIFFRLMDAISRTNLRSL